MSPSPNDVEAVQPARQHILLPAMPRLGGLYAKAAGRTVAQGATIGARRALKGLPLPVPGKREPRGAGGSGVGRRLHLPNIELHVPGVAVDAAGHQEFCSVVQAPQHTTPQGHTEAFSGYLHALAFPAAMALLTRDDFPLPTVGLVHLANSVSHRQAVTVGDRLDVTVWAENLRPHRVGAQFDVVVELRPSVTAAGADSREANDDGAGSRPRAEASSVAQPVWIGRSVYLARGVKLASSTTSGQEQRPSVDPGSIERAEFVPPVPTGRWQLGADLGRRYAAVSGDVNPIHLSGPSARALGMKAAIAHGMYTASRALAMVDTPAPLTWEVEFATPVLLPSAPAVAVDRDGRGDAFHKATVSVWNAKKAKPHATITVSRGAAELLD